MSGIVSVTTWFGKQYLLFMTVIIQSVNSIYFAEGRSSNDPHSQIYAGDKAFSAVEAYTLSQFISSISDKFYAYIAFHSYGQKLLIPYSYTTEHLDNYDDEV